MIQGYNSEDIASGIDEMMIRQPLGVTAIIAPFNFPGMIAFWFLPYSLACGNTVIVKPSERVPLTMQKVFALLDRLKLPEGVVNLVNGGREAVDAILDHPVIRSVSFVGLEHRRAARLLTRGRGRQARAVPGRREEPGHRHARRRHVVGGRDHRRQRRSAAPASAAWRRRSRSPSAKPARPFTDAIGERAASRVTGYGLDDGVQMGPVISSDSRARIEALIDKAIRDGARPVVDGRRPEIPKYAGGYFVAADGARRTCRSRARWRGPRSSGRCCRCTTCATSTRRSGW